jgi:hypothetical protein
MSPACFDTTSESISAGVYTSAHRSIIVYPGFMKFTRKLDNGEKEEEGRCRVEDARI